MERAAPVGRPRKTWQNTLSVDMSLPKVNPTNKIHFASKSDEVENEFVSQRKIFIIIVKVYKVAVRPAMLYGLETVALTKRQEAEMEVAELKMLRVSLGVTRMDKNRNECIRGTVWRENTRGKTEMVWTCTEER